MVGETLSHYKILEKIGQGGMGEVFLVQDTTLDRKVVLKFLPEELQQDTATRKRFWRAPGRAHYDVHPDGRFLMMNMKDPEETRPRINVVLNWFEELKRLVPTE